MSTELDDRILQAIEKNLPAQLGKALQCRLEAAEETEKALRRRLEDAEHAEKTLAAWASAARSYRAQRDDLNRQLAALQPQLAQAGKLAEREAAVSDRERSLSLDKLQHELACSERFAEKLCAVLDAVVRFAELAPLAMQPSSAGPSGEAQQPVDAASAAG